METTKNPVTRLAYYLKPYMGLLGLQLVLTILFAASNILAIPLVRDMSNAVTHNSKYYLGSHMFNMGICAVVYVVTKYAQQYVMTYISYSILIKIRLELYEKLLRLPLSFYKQWKQGEIISRVFSDGEVVRDAIVNGFKDILPSIFTFIGVLGYLLYLNWRLTLIVFATVPLVIFNSQYFGARIRKESSTIQNKTASITHIFQETISNISIIKAFTLESNRTHLFDSENHQNFLSQLRSLRFRINYQSLLEITQFLLMVFLVWFGGYEVVTGVMSGPELLSFFTGLLLLSEPTINMSYGYTRFQQGIVSARRIFNILDIQESIQNRPNAIQNISLDGGIEFKNISFWYSTAAEPIIKNVSLSVQPGEIVALVGHSGSGKSTLINLIPRFYDASEGSVLISGTDVRDIDLYTLRSQIGLVTQESLLFRGSIFNNIRFGKLDATMDEVIEAAKQAHAHEFIEKLPLQYNTLLMDRGVSVSGGQRQRISIARAILKNPKILILDEATSALDSESEGIVQDALYSLMKNRTTFVIAHRLSTILHAHKIVVVKEGQISEIGTHESLLENGGIYRNLYDMQFNREIGS